MWAKAVLTSLLSYRKRVLLSPAQELATEAKRPAQGYDSKVALLHLLAGAKWEPNPHKQKSHRAMSPTQNEAQGRLLLQVPYVV